MKKMKFINNNKINEKKVKKSSFKKYLFIKIFFPISIATFIIIVIISSILISYENKKLNLFLINETNLIANLMENTKLYEVILLNRSINKNSSILFRDPILNYEIHLTKSPPFPLEIFDNIFLEKKSGYFLNGKYKVFFTESFLSRVCILIVPRMLFYSITFKILIISIIVYLLINFLLYFLILKVEKATSYFLTNQYIFIKYILEGKYNTNEKTIEISEIDNIRFGLNNLVSILKERREFYNSLILFQKKILDIIPVGIIIFNEKGLFEDANKFGYAQIEREIKKSNINVDDFSLLLIEKFSIESLISSDSLSLLNPINTVELKVNPNITFSKRVFGKIVSDKRIIILVPLNIKIEDEKDDKFIILRQTIVPFLSDFAHELRSPLNSILGFSQIIKDGVEGENIEEIVNDVKIINEAGQLMMAFIDDIIFLSRLGIKKVESMNLPFNLVSLFTLVNHYFKGIFRNKDTTISLPENVENKEIIGDFQGIRRIILLFFFYLRSLFPLPSNIEISLESKEEKFYLIKINYSFPHENIQYQKISGAILDFYNQIYDKSSVEIENKQIDKKNGSFEIKFYYKD